jgi:hypothetical protein
MDSLDFAQFKSENCYNGLEYVGWWTVPEKNNVLLNHPEGPFYNYSNRQTSNSFTVFSLYLPNKVLEGLYKNCPIWEEWKACITFQIHRRFFIFARHWRMFHIPEVVRLKVSVSTANGFYSPLSYRRNKTSGAWPLLHFFPLVSDSWRKASMLRWIISFQKVMR